MTGKREQSRAVSGSTSRRAHPPATGIAHLPDVEPNFVQPMQCKLVDHLPAGPEWIYELKFDGYRALAVKAGQTVRLISREREGPHFQLPGDC